jgi:hypothetical protein
MKPETERPEKEGENLLAQLVKAMALAKEGGPLASHPLCQKDPSLADLANQLRSLKQENKNCRFV